MKKKLMILIPLAVMLGLLVVLAGSLGLYFRNGYTYSAFEVRNLAQFPVCSAETLTDASYFQSWENFLSDQFIGRNYFLKAYNLLQLKVLGKETVNDLVVSPNGAILPKQAIAATEYPAELAATVIENHAALNAVVGENGGQLLFVSVPGQGSILRSFYPDKTFNNAENLNLMHDRFFSEAETAGLAMLDLSPAFEATQDATHLYFRTDHHYTLPGAFLAYEEICKKLQTMGINADATTQEDYNWQTLPNAFAGSRGRQLFHIVDFGEKLQIATLKEPIEFVRYDSGQLVDSTVYDLPTGENEGVDYNLYMGGDKAETIIQTNRPSLPNCLLVGASYTNAVEAFLYTSFNETRSLDLRHYTDMTLQEYVRQYQPDVVILLRDDGHLLDLEGNGNVS